MYFRKRKAIFIAQTMSYPSIKPPVSGLKGWRCIYTDMERTFRKTQIRPHPSQGHAGYTLWVFISPLRLYFGTREEHVYCQCTGYWFRCLDLTWGDAYNLRSDVLVVTKAERECLAIVIQLPMKFPRELGDLGYEYIWNDDSLNYLRDKFDNMNIWWLSCCKHTPGPMPILWLAWYTTLRPLICGYWHRKEVMETYCCVLDDP